MADVEKPLRENKRGEREKKEKRKMIRQREEGNMDEREEREGI